MADKLCETCAAFDGGECRRYAPKPFVFGQAREEPEDPEDSAGHFLTTWPQTCKYDWCCEWLPKPPEPGEC